MKEQRKKVNKCKNNIMSEGKIIYKSEEECILKHRKLDDWTGVVTACCFASLSHLLVQLTEGPGLFIFESGHIVVIVY